MKLSPGEVKKKKVFVSTTVWPGVHDYCETKNVVPTTSESLYLLVLRENKYGSTLDMELKLRMGCLLKLDIDTYLGVFESRNKCCLRLTN